MFLNDIKRVPVHGGSLRLFVEKRENVTPSVVEVNRLENEADRLHQDVITCLFDEEKDPILIMKWKEIFDYLEATVDSIEDVSDVIQGVVLKHA